LGAGHRQLVTQTKIHRQLTGRTIVVLHKSRVAEALCADGVNEADLARRTSSAGKAGRTNTNEEAGEPITAGSVVGIVRDLIAAAAIKREISGGPARVGM